MHDVIIVGGGIAGLSAALILGRCRRNVLVCDTGKPRNGRSKALHGFLTRDGIDPFEMRRLAREELRRYETVALREAEVIDTEEVPSGYAATLDDGTTVTGSYLLIATGVVDKLPAIEGLAELYGTSVFHCPYCDGWERRDQALAAYGDGEEACQFALELTGWSHDVVLCLDGGRLLPPEQEAVLTRNGIGIAPQPIARLEATDGRLSRIVFTDGTILPRDALFFTPDQFQASPLAEKLGCTISGGVVHTAKFQAAGSRLFVAGDAARSVQLAIVAAAEGAEAAFAINTALQKRARH